MLFKILCLREVLCLLAAVGVAAVAVVHVVAVALDAYMTFHMSYMPPAGAGNAENCVVRESKNNFLLSNGQ